MSGALRVTIAGGGVLGLTTALALADAGCAVTLHDPGRPNASSVAAGMIAPEFEAVLDPLSRTHLGLFMAARDRWPGLAARAGVTLDRSGAMAVGEGAWLAEVAAGFGALHLRPAELTGRAARAMAPGLAEDVESALLSREDWRVDAPAALAQLRAAAAGAGVVVRQEPVTERPGAGVLVLATGAASMAHLAPELSILTPIKGHIVRVAGPATGATVRGRDVYAAPGAGLTFGATMEPGRADMTVEPGKADALLAAGLRLFPDHAGAAVEAAVGIRAATPDGLPLVGWSQSEGVVVLAGARRNGWLLAPLVAQVAVALVLGRDSGPYEATFAPGRFGGTA